MKSPENIEELTQLLSETSKEHYNSILHSFDFNIINFQPFESWSSKKYTRNCLYRDSHFELILICWNKRQETSIHNHDGEDCWVYLLEGKLEEVFYNVDSNNHLKKERSQSILPNQLSFINDRVGLHKLKNVNDGPSVSLHLYAKPIEQCRFYCETTERFIERKLNYDTFKELELDTKQNSV